MNVADFVLMMFKYSPNIAMVDPVYEHSNDTVNESGIFSPKYASICLNEWNAQNEE